MNARQQSISIVFFSIFILLPGCFGLKPRDKSRPPRLVVVVSVDQMRADYMIRFADLFNGGLARMNRDGIVFTDAHHGHAVTSTGAGHASISTGVYPHRSGIVDNSWWDREAKRSVYVTEDTVSILGISGAPGSSPANLLCETVGDWLKQQSPDAKVFSVALKDRASILMAGHEADAAYWYYDTEGVFVTSSYYMSAYPDWVTTFNTSGIVDTFLETGWARLLDETAYSISREDNFPNEMDGKNTTFPHLFSTPTPGPEYYSELYQTPFGDELAFSFARDLVFHEGLGADAIPDLLFIGASAGDGVGHAYGPFSQEVQDYYLRMDLMLQSFFEFLDEEVGSNEYIIVLTADHGVLPMPEELRRHGIDAGRFDPQPLIRQQVEKTSDKLGIETRLRFANGLYLDIRERNGQNITRQQVRKAIADDLRDLDLVEDVFTFDELVDPQTPDRPFFQQYSRSFYPDRAPDLMLRYKEYYLPIRQTTSTSHGSPYEYDTHVPLIFLDPVRRAARHDTRVYAVDIAPTLASLLNIVVPEELDGKKLQEVLQVGRPVVSP